jgi:hypothetical protein
MFCLLLTSYFLGTVQPFHFDMTPQEKKQTGVYKLSDKEQAALQIWIENNYAKRDKPLHSSGEGGLLQENLKNGQYIRLSNGSLWAIHPKDVPITQGWITPVQIVVTSTGDAEYSYKLTNSLTGSAVRAKKAPEP